MKNSMSSRCAAATVVAAFALVATAAKADDVFWNPAVTEGLFTDGSSWVGGAAPVTENHGVFSNLAEAVTVSFPAGTTEVALAPSFWCNGDNKNDAGFDVTLDASGKTVLWGKDDAANCFPVQFKKTYGYSPFGIQAAVSGRTDFMTLSDTVLRIANDRNTTSISATGGYIAATNGEFVLNFSGYGGAPTTSFALTNLTFDLRTLYLGRGVDMVAKGVSFGGDFRTLAVCPTYTGLRASGSSTVRLEDATWRIEGQNNIALGIGGSAQGVNARLEVAGDSTIYLKNTKQNTGGRNSYLTIASGANASGVVDISGTSAFSLVGASGYDNEGMIRVGNGATTTGALAVRDSATLYAYNDIVVANAADATGLFCLSNTAVATARRRVYLGYESSKDARLVVTDNAKLVTPLIEARASSSENFVTNRFEFSGGTVETKQVVGADQMVLALAGTPLFKATAASTSAAPFLSSATVEAEDGTVVVIDTQSYATYIDQDFGAGVTVVKRGSGTLYVKNSNHAKTIIEAGAVAFYDDATHFGDEWEVSSDATPPYPLAGATAEGDTDLVAFSSQAAAEAFILVYEKAYTPADGWAYSFSAVEDPVSGLWTVTATAAVATPAALVWSGADGDSWASASSWTPAQVPTHNDDATVSGAATIAMPDSARAKSLTLSGDGAFATTGDSDLQLSGRLSLSSVSPVVKTISVADGGALRLSATTQEVSNVAFAKEGAGTLEVAYSDQGVFKFADGTMADGAELSVREGSMRVNGTGHAAIANAKWGNTRTGTMLIDTLAVGTATMGTAPALAELVLDNCGQQGGITVGGGNAALSRLVITNNTLVLVRNYVPSELSGVPYMSGTAEWKIEAASGKTSELDVFGASIVISAGQNVYLGSQSTADCGTTRVRVGNGGSIGTTGGGNRDGRLWLGGGLDMEVEDGGTVSISERAGTDTTHLIGWIRGTSYASGTVTVREGGCFAFGGGFSMNNYSVEHGPSKKFTLAFDGGTFVPAVPTYATDADVSNLKCRYLVMRAPEYQGIEVLAGGMNVDMSESNASRYTIACPIRGTGALVKTGSGTLVMGKGHTFAASYKGANYRDGTVTNSADVVDSGIVTVQNAGGVVVAEGAVEIEAGATDANSAFTVQSGAALDLGGNTVAVGTVGGAGTVSNGVFSAVTLSAVGDGDDVPTFTDVAFAGFVAVDFGCDAESPADKKRQYKVATLGANVTGKLTDGMTLGAANTGNANLRKAKISVDGSGNVTATPVTGDGFMFLVW